jgi:hypothetical protein
MGNMKTPWSGTLWFMNVGTLPCVKICLGHWVFGLCLSSDFLNSTPNISLDQRLTLRPNWIETSPCFDLRMESGQDSKIFCTVYSSKYWRESRHPVILSVMYHRQNSIQLVSPYLLEPEVGYSKSITLAWRALGTTWKAEGGETNRRNGNPVPTAESDANTNKKGKVVVTCSRNFYTFSTSLNSLIPLDSKITILWHLIVAGKNKLTRIFI